MAASAENSQRQYLTFFIAGEEYGIGVLRAREIIEYGAITKVPTVPSAIRGVINLRGAVVPVVDLGLRFGLPERPVTRRTCIIIVEAMLDGEPTVMGIIADTVSQVIDLPADAIAPPPAFGTRVRVDCLVGMGVVGDKFVLLLDLDRVLSMQELLAGSALAAASPVEPQPEGER